MHEAYFDYRVRDLLHAVDCRRARLVRERAIDDDGVRIASPRRWHTWRRRQVRESTDPPTFVGTIRSGVSAPSLRVQAPDHVVKVVLPRAFGYRLRTRRLPQTVTPPEQRPYQDIHDGVVEYESKNVTEVTLVLDEASPYEAVRVETTNPPRLDAYDANQRLLGFASTEKLPLRIPIELSDQLFGYQPSALLVIEERSHPTDPLHLLVEAGTTEHDVRIDTVMRSLWLPAVNRMQFFGRWGYLRLEGDAEERDRKLRVHLDALTRDESPWDWIDYGR